MSKSNQIKKLVNGEIADADDVNQIAENVGAEGGSIPYDPTSHERETNGSESLGSTAYPWGSLNINQDAELIEVDKDSHTAASTIAIKNLRKFITLKDTPAAYTGYGGLPLVVKTTEDGVEFKVYQASQLFTSSGTFIAPTGVSVIFVTIVGSGGGGGAGSTRPSGGGGGGSGAYVVRKAVVVSAGNSYTVTVGNAGSGGSGGNGTSGGAVSFAGENTTISCNGGSYGTRSTSGAGIGGAGGTVSGTSATPTAGQQGGGAGLAGECNRTTAGVDGADGGSDGASDSGGGGAGSSFGNGGAGGQPTSGAGGSADGYGAGGGGGASTAGNGGNGSKGFVYIEW